jgi:hypothetical protein
MRGLTITLFPCLEHPSSQFVPDLPSFVTPLVTGENP